MAWTEGVKKKSFPQRDGGMNLHCTVFFTLGRKCLNETDLEIETNIFKVLATLKKRIPHLNPCCLQQESSKKPACSCQLKFVVFFCNPNKVTPIDFLWCFAVSGSLRKKKAKHFSFTRTTFITVILHVLNLSEFLKSILKGERKKYEIGQNPKRTI